MEQQRLTKGIWIPIEIWKDKKLTWKEKILFLEIDSFTSRNKDCYFSNEYIAELLDVNETNANKILSSLIRKGYVIKTRFDGRHRYVKTALQYTTSQNCDDCKPELSEEASQGCQYQQCSFAAEGNHNNTYNNQNNNEEEKDKEKEDESSSKKKRFAKPTVEEIRQYVESQNYHVDAERFFDYYESNGWSVGRSSMKDWQAAVRTWERNRNDGNKSTSSMPATNNNSVGSDGKVHCPPDADISEIQHISMKNDLWYELANGTLVYHGELYK